MVVAIAYSSSENAFPRGQCVQLLVNGSHVPGMSVCKRVMHEKNKVQHISTSIEANGTGVPFLVDD